MCGFVSQSKLSSCRPARCDAALEPHLHGHAGCTCRWREGGRKIAFGNFDSTSQCCKDAASKCNQIQISKPPAALGETLPTAQRRPPPWTGCLSTPRSAQHLGSFVMISAFKKITPRQTPRNDKSPGDGETIGAHVVTPPQAAVLDVEGQATESFASNPATGYRDLATGGLIEVPDEPRPVNSALSAMGLFVGFVLLALVLHHGMPWHVYAPYLFALCSSPMIYMTWLAEQDIRDKSGMTNTWLAVAILFVLLYFTLAGRFGWWPSSDVYAPYLFALCSSPMIYITWRSEQDIRDKSGMTRTWLAVAILLVLLYFTMAGRLGWWPHE